MKLNRKLPKLERGFSLVEMLVVISVIGIIAGVSVPMISTISGTAEKNKAIRNAQTLSSLHSAAISAGGEITATTASGIADAIISGVSGTKVDGSYFQANMSREERDAALAHLVYDDATGTLAFTPNGGTAGNDAFSVGDLDSGILSLGGAITVFQQLEEGAAGDEMSEQFVELFLGALASQAASEQDMASGNYPAGPYDGISGNLNQLAEAYQMAQSDAMSSSMNGDISDDEALNDARAAYFEARDLVLQEALENQHGNQLIIPNFTPAPGSPGDPGNLDGIGGSQPDMFEMMGDFMQQATANDEAFGGRSVTFTQVAPPFPDLGVEEPDHPGLPGETTYFALELN